LLEDLGESMAEVERQSQRILDELNQITRQLADGLELEPFPEEIDRSKQTHTRFNMVYQYSSVKDPEYDIDLFENGLPDFFQSEDRENQFIIFEALKQRLFVGYQLNSYGFRSGAAHLKQWKLVVQRQDGLCFVADRQDSDVLNDRSAVYKCRFLKPILCRKLKLVMTGRNHAGNWHLVLQDIHFETVALD
jgi:hypothetical protein